MQDIFLLISLILGLPIGILLFCLVNDLFDIYYFGWAGIGSTFMGCYSVGFGIILFLLNILGFLAVPIGIVCVVLWIKGRGKSSE